MNLKDEILPVDASSTCTIAGLEFEIVKVC